jgi:PAS domain S-box-containing protein
MRLDEAGLWFGPENEELAYALRSRTSVWLGTVLRASALVVATAAIAAVATRSAPVWWIFGLFALVIGAALLLDATKRTREAGVVLSLGFWAAATAAVFCLGGVRSPGSFVYLPIVITAGLFWHWRAAAALAAASLGAVILAALLDHVHLLPLPLHAPTAARLLPIFAGSLTMTVVLVGIALHTLRGALQDVRRHALRSEELLLTVPDVLAVLDRHGVVLAVGPSMQERTGYAPNELVGKGAADGLAVARDIVQNTESGAAERQHRAHHVADADPIRDRGGDSFALLPGNAAVEVGEEFRVTGLSQNRIDVEPMRPRELEVPANALHGDRAPLRHFDPTMMHQRPTHDQRTRSEGWRRAPRRDF